MDLTSATFWAALGSIILTNILLSGDNAVVIALAARSLPPEKQKKAIVFGSAAAIVMRIVLTVLAAEMLKWPYLKIIGALLLLYIGVSLMLDDDGDGDVGSATTGMLAAIRTILVADLVMSLDNVLAVAAAAQGSNTLLILGLAISIPLIVFGSTMLLKVMERFPILITLGAALLGFLAGEMLLSDLAVEREFGHFPHHYITVAGALGAAIVVASGKYLQRRSTRESDALPS